MQFQLIDSALEGSSTSSSHPADRMGKQPMPSPFLEPSVYPVYAEGATIPISPFSPQPSPLPPHSNELPESETDSEPPRCSVCGYKYTCATCILYSLAARWAIGGSSSSSRNNTITARDSSSTSSPDSSPQPSAGASELPPTLGAASDPTSYCTICDIPLFSSPRQITAHCTHLERVCSECMRRWLQHTVASGLGVGLGMGLRCPVVHKCGEELEYEDVRYWAGEEVFERYDKLLLQRNLTQEPEFYWCLNARCQNGQLHDPLHLDPLPPMSPTSPPAPTPRGACNPNILTCHTCHASQCVLHQMPWHTGLTCEEYEKQKEGRGWWDGEKRRERGVRRWLGRKTRSCPGCGKNIEKREGCDHMTCRLPWGCGAEFCWRCGGDYALIYAFGNSSHKRWCKYYAPTTRRRWKFWRRRREVDW